MAIGFRNAASVGIGGSGSLTCSVPSGVVNGDLMVAVIDVIVSAGTLTIPTPSGWTVIPGCSQIAPSTAGAAMFWRIASSEPGSYTFTFSGVTQAGASAIISAYSGATLIDISGSGTSASTPISAPAVTTTNPTDWLIRVWASNSTNDTLGAPSSGSNRAAITSGSPACNIQLYDSNGTVSPGVQAAQTATVVALGGEGFTVAIGAPSSRSVCMII